MENIYTLYFGDNECKAVFYVGHTGDPKRRLSDHKRDSKTGTEDKYRYIQQELVPAGIDWGMEVIKEIPAGEYPDDYERHYVIKYILAGHPIQNMKHGDLSKKQELAEQLADDRVRTVEEVRADRVRRASIIAAKNLERAAKFRMKVEAEDRAKQERAAWESKIEHIRQKQIEFEKGHEMRQQEIRAYKLVKEREAAEKLALKKILEDKRNMELAELRKEQERKWREDNDRNSL
jgi:hypothetical protein